MVAGPTSTGSAAVAGPAAPSASVAPASAAPAVELRGVWAAYGGDPVLRNVTLEVGAGERRAIVGPSGSGKSTLLKVLKGLVPRVRGEVRTLGMPVSNGRGRGVERRRLGARVGYIPQNLGLVTSATVLQNALMGALHRTGAVRSWLGVFSAAEVETAWEALEAVGIAQLADRRAHELSGGERRRLAVARTLVQRPELLLADEFLSELDGATAEQVLRALEVAQRTLGMTVVLVEHDLRVACTFCDRVTVLCEGCKVGEVRGQESNEEELRCLMCPRVVA